MCGVSQFVGAIRTVTVMSPFAKGLSSINWIIHRAKKKDRKFTPAPHYSHLNFNRLDNCFLFVRLIVNKVCQREPLLLFFFFWGVYGICYVAAVIYWWAHWETALADIFKSSFRRTFLNRHLSCVYISSIYAMDPTKHAHSHTHSFAYTLLNLHTRQQQSFWRYASYFRKALRIREERSENRVRSVWTLGSNYCAITKIHALV